MNEFEFIKNTVSIKDRDILIASFLYFNSRVYFEFLDKFCKKYDLGVIELEEYINKIIENK